MDGEAEADTDDKVQVIKAVKPRPRPTKRIKTEICTCVNMHICLTKC